MTGRHSSGRCALIVVPAGSWQESGNWITARRIAENVTAHGWCAEISPADRLPARMAQGGVQVLHAIHARKSGVEVLRSAAETGLPYIVTCSGTDLAVDIDDPQAGEEVRRVMRRTAAVTVFHRSAADVVLRALPQVAERLVIIPPGVEELRGGPNRARYGLSEEDFVFLLPAGVRAVKRPTLAAAPLADLALRYPRVRLVVAGPALEEEAVQALREAQSDRPWLRWLGAVPHAEMGQIYRSADAVLNTSLHEGLSNAVMEAMRIGLPLILFDNPGNREAAAQDALYFQDEGGLLAACERLISNPLLGARLGHAARQRAERVFSPEREAASYVDLYERALQCAEAAAGEARR